ncbi:MAG: cytochrome d ubiquinol oxidase subunit II [Alicyclobacillus herbarius]|uniref:cytochrome d ubiquinol oxidase subunit II n=1 Tax=Alicyclobacillus herbarius TaxID=122960 RepID=UPI002354B0D1|nr:cytochrome d ubiquinol oxidase subunit II [Alicyclobacillus herbarius]MCL6633716.1 cytochrome d ubiquinol oxidase subunit II [Alicyclobacillus herbarius]
MNLVPIGTEFIWIMIFVYAILGAIDFGASFWRWRFSLTGNWEAADIAQKFVSPTWELVNSFLALVPVALVGLFPGAASAYGEVLLIPAFLVLALLILRGAYWQFGYASTRKDNRTIWVVGITGLILPGLFTTILALSQGGYVAKARDGSYTLPMGKFLLSPDVIVFFLFGLTMSLYLSALFLTQYAKRADNLAAYQAFRKSAINMGPFSLVTGFLVLVITEPGQLDISHRLIPWWPLLTVSFLAFLFGYAWLIKNTTPGRPGVSLWATIVQLVCAQIAYGAAHYPYALYPYLTFRSAASNPSMFVTTLIVFIAGFILLAPGFILFRRLFITDVKYSVSH